MEQNQPDKARAAFLADQEAAQAEQSTRDETAWELNVRNGMANALQAETHAAHMAAKAKFWDALAGMVYVATTLAVGAVLWYVIALIVEAVR